ncbi:MAG TPA: transposase, partial [Thermomicrobiales bacterium]|nr:transposase [Thermomicrobiales bacterium]
MRRLVRALADPRVRREGQLHWSRWRRDRQAGARRCHEARRGGHRAPADPTPLVAVAVPGTPALTDAGWARVAPLLPGNGRRGKQWRDHRGLVAGVLWVMHTGATWRELPAEYGPWRTCHSRYARWRRDGTWGRLVAALLAPVPPGGPGP